MDNQLTNIGIVRESRNDENRTPLVPEHIKKYKESNQNINFIIQPSNNRCFSDEEYELSGAIINENLMMITNIFGAIYLISFIHHFMFMLTPLEIVL